MSNKRRKFSKEFKAKVVLEALKERETLEVLAKKHELFPTQISLWKAEAMANFENVFANGKKDEVTESVDIKGLYAQIGQQKVEIDFLKKKLF
jgi:transposase-like protein